MTRLFFTAAAALLAAGCATYDPPGARYPYHAVPPDYAYPPPPGAYPPGAYPPGSYPPGAGADCPILSSRNWTAFVDRMPGPGARPQLVASGEVVAPTAGYEVQIEDLVIRESYPVQAVAVVEAIPPSGPAAQVVDTHLVRRQWPLVQPVGSVEIVCGGETLARISQVQTAY